MGQLVSGVGLGLSGNWAGVAALAPRLHGAPVMADSVLVMHPVRSHTWSVDKSSIEAGGSSLKWALMAELGTHLHGAPVDSDCVLAVNAAEERA